MVGMGLGLSGQGGVGLRVRMGHVHGSQGQDGIWPKLQMVATVPCRIADAIVRHVIECALLLYNSHSAPPQQIDIMSRP